MYDVSYQSMNRSLTPVIIFNEGSFDSMYDGDEEVVSLIGKQFLFEQCFFIHIYADVLLLKEYKKL